MYVITSEAALLLQIPHRRLLDLLKKGRVKGAYKSGRFWLIPLYNGLPQIIPGKRGRKGAWVKTILPKKIIVHVNRNRIEANKNKSPEEREEVITVKSTSKTSSKHQNQKNGNFYTNHLEIPYPCRIIYRPNKPLHCGAHLWIEILGENIHKLKSQQPILKI